MYARAWCPKPRLDNSLVHTPKGSQNPRSALCESHWFTSPCLQCVSSTASGMCRNLPFSGARGCIFHGSKMRGVATNVYSRKTLEKLERCGLRTLIVKGSGVVFKHGEGISTPRVRHMGRQPLIECARHDFKIMYFPHFLCLYVFSLFYPFFSFCGPFCIFYLFVVDKGVSLCSYVFLNWDEKIWPT